MTPNERAALVALVVILGAAFLLVMANLPAL